MAPHQYVPAQSLPLDRGGGRGDKYLFRFIPDYTEVLKNSVMHSSATALPRVAVALIEVKPGTTKDLVCPDATAASVATIAAPLRNVKVMAAELVDVLLTKPDAATGAGLGPNKVLADTAAEPAR